MTAEEIEDLQRRVEQIEKALWAVALGGNLVADQNGRIMAQPKPKERQPVTSSIGS